MNKLDDRIIEVAYILDCLMAYRRIIESGNCNRCAKVRYCKHAPKLGELVRYNCYEFIGGETG